MIIIIMLYASVHIHTCIHAYTHTYIYTYNEYIHTYIHTYIIVSSCLAAENSKDTYRVGGGDRGCGNAACTTNTNAHVNCTQKNVYEHKYKRNCTDRLTTTLTNIIHAPLRD